MYRFFLRKRRLLPCVCVGMLLSTLVILIFDDTFDQQDHVHVNSKHVIVRRKDKGFNATFQQHGKSFVNPKEKPFKAGPLEFVEHENNLPQNRLDFGHNNNHVGELKHDENIVRLDQQRVPPPSQNKIVAVEPQDQNMNAGVNVNVDKKNVGQQRDSQQSHQDVGEQILPQHEELQENFGNVRQRIGWKPPINAGENGRGVIVDRSQLNEEQQQEMKKGKKTHSFNEFVSKLISVRRSLPDVRDPECRSIQYPPDLPDASVVIIFHNEAWSTLLRTLHSALERSPPQLLKQVLLVDDYSDLEHLKTPLDQYVSHLPKVSVIRSPTREGLIKARLLGLSHVTSRVVVFLDSHCECAQGWLEPLLERIYKDPTNVVVPIIDAINDETFQFNYASAKYANVGTFNWALMFNWMQIQPGELARRKSIVEPIRTPTMAGGLFAIDRDYFYKLGTYDPGMKIWGGENLELSFKIWMCGGTLETAPCSHVGHVFRNTSPHSSGGYRNYLSTNINRLTAVWLDEYSFYSNRARRVRQSDVNVGDIAERLELRRRLKCHSFGWYMKHVMPEKYLPADRVAHGAIENKFTRLCVVSDEKRAILSDCRTRVKFHHSSQWNMNPGESTIFQESYNLERTCLDFSGKEIIENVQCHGLGGNQMWTYDKDIKQLQHQASGLCLEVSGDGDSADRPVLMSIDFKGVLIYVQDIKQLQHQASGLCLEVSGNSDSDRPVLMSIDFKGVLIYVQDIKQLQHQASGLCIEVSGDSVSAKPVMSPCDPTNPRQRWDWETKPLEGPSWRKDEAAGIPVL